MRDVLAQLAEWWESGAEVAVGTVVATWSSAPRQPGAAMLVGPDGTAVGSVSGGCVEGAVYELAQSVLTEQQPVLERYGVSDDDEFSVGLTCGGIIDIFVESIDQENFPDLGDVITDIREGRPVAVATLIAGPEENQVGTPLVIRPDTINGSLGIDRFDDAVRDDARGMLEQGATGV